jgi:vacuolar-type H+-ATPase subunit H
MLDKLKKLADQAKEKATPLAEQAAHRAAELATEAREKAGPLAEQAKERAAELATKAAPAVSQGVDKAAERIDKATGGRYTSHLDKVQGVVHEKAGKVAGSASEGQSTAAPTAAEQSASTPEPPVGTSAAEPPVGETATIATDQASTVGTTAAAGTETVADPAVHKLDNTSQEAEGS